MRLAAKITTILPTAILLAMFTVSAAYAATYEIDTAHTTVGFKVRHLAISTVPGVIGEFSGTFSFDPANIAASTASVELKPQSINTNNKKRDDHLRNDDFFAVAKYPTITFVSKKVVPTGAESFDAHGDLTIRGVTKPVVLAVTYQGKATDPWGNERAAFSAKTKINRKDFGLNYNKVLETGGLMVGEEVTIDLEVQGIKKVS